MDTGLKQDNRLLKTKYLLTLFPVMFSVLGATINTLIDSIFVSQRLGGGALAAVNLSMPVYLILCTVGSLIAGGASVCSAREAGRENMIKSQDYYRGAFALSAAVSVLFTVLGIIFCRPLSEILSGGGVLTEQVYSYCIVTCIGTGASVMMYLPFSYLQIEGKTRAISVSVIIMVTTDILFDILFLFVFDFGLYGASAASVLSAVAATVYGFAALGSGESNYRIGSFRPDIKRFGEVIRYGSPAALGNLFDAVKLLALNMIILAALGENGAAVWAVLNTFSELSLMIITGVPRAGAPMISALSTARENGAIRILTALEVRIGLLLSVGYAVLISLLNQPVAAFFGVGSDLLVPMICLGVNVILSVLCCIWEKHFNSIGLIAEANIASGARCCLLPVAAALILAPSGAELWLFLPLSALASVAVIVVLIFVRAAQSRRTDKPLSAVLLLDDRLEAENKILDFSIAADMNEVCDAAEKLKDFCSANQMDMKLTMKLGLAIEELLNVIIEKTPDIGSIDIRAFALDGSTGVRIKCAGRNYDPFSDKAREEDDEFFMGINLIHKMADTTTHKYIFGMNLITILFPFSKPTEKKGK